MLAFLRRNQILVSSCLCLFISLYILASSARGQLKNEPLGILLMWILRPIQIAGSSTANWVTDIRQNFNTFGNLKSENAQLRARIEGLEVERNQLLEAATTNRRLRELLDFRNSLPSGAITASIIANSASSWFQSVLINKGITAGVKKGMAVVTPQGVVGQVVAVTSNSAKILLMTDVNSGVDVLVQRTRTRGIVSGSLDRGTMLKYVKRSDAIEKGDRLITSGLGGVFPKGLMVATVIKVDRQPLGLFQTVLVEPTVTFARLEEVLVVGVGPDGGNP